MTGTEKSKSPRNLKHFLLPGCGGCQGTLLAAFYLYWKKSTKSQNKVWRCNNSLWYHMFFTWAKEPCQGSQKCRSGWAPVTCEAHRYLQWCPALCLQGWGKPQTVLDNPENRSQFLRCLASVLAAAHKRNGSQALLAGLNPQALWCWCPQAVMGRPVPKCFLFPWEEWEDPRKDPIFAAPTGLLLLLAQLRHWAPALAGALQKATGGSCSGLCQHITSLSKATGLPAPAGPSVVDVAVGLSHWAVHLLSCLVFGKEKTGNCEQSRDVVWSQMCWWVLQRKHFLFELSALSVAWHNILSSF